VSRVHPKDRTLVEISLGTDVGVNEGHTLEVYRLKPQPEYCGRIQIIEAHPRNAIGRVVRGSKIEAGDEITSSIR
jgi:hypothetical protein